MPVNQEHFLQEFKGNLNDIRDGIRDGLSVVNSRLTAIDNRLQSGEDRFQRLETKVFSGSPSPGGGEYYTVSVGKRTVLSVPKETMAMVKKWGLVILACLVTGNADRLYVLVMTTARAAVEVAAPVPSTSDSGEPDVLMTPER